MKLILTDCNAEAAKYNPDQKQNHDKIYNDWKNIVNVSAKELSDWKQNPFSRLASLKPIEVIDRNINLLETPRKKWTVTEYKNAVKTINFNTRHLAQSTPGKPISKKIPFSKRDIALINWAHLPEDRISKKDFKYWISKQGISKAKEILKDDFKKVNIKNEETT